MMTATYAVFRRELAGYFATPVAYVFIVVFLALNGALTFNLGGFFERGQADLQAFFTWHPWLYLLLAPAIAMRLWAEERRSGSIELLLTLPLPLGAAVLGKFLAAWVFFGVALALTAPIWVTVNILGDPDNGVIFASYLGSWLMAGGFIAAGACMSAATTNQVVAFVLGAALCFLLTVAGTPVVQGFFAGWAPAGVVDAVSGLSFLTHFQAITRGVVDLRDVIFFLSAIATFLFVNAILIDRRKGA